MVGEADRERRWHCSLLHPEAMSRPNGDLELDLLARQALVVQLVEAELLGRDRLELRNDRLDPVELERGHDDVLLAVPLGVEKWVRNRDRHLVPHLRRPQRIRVDQDVRQGA